MTIRWASYPVNPDWDNTLRRAAEQFSAEHPTIDVQIEFAGDHWDRIRVQYAAGSAPDVVLLNFNWLPAAVEQGMLVDLLPYFERDGINMNDYFPISFADWTLGGGLYAGILYWGGEAFFYNRDLFDAAGVPYVDLGWDWATMLDAARVLTRDTNGDGIPDQWGIHVVDKSAHFTSGSFIRGAGGEVLNEARDESLLNMPEAAMALEFLAALEHEHGVAVPTGTPGDVASFQLGNVGMAFHGTWTAAIYRQAGLNWAYGYPPAGPVRRNVQVGSNAWGIISNTEHPEEAWEFMKWLIGEGGQKAIGTLGIPGLRSVAFSPEYLAPWVDHDLPTYLDSVQNWGHDYYPTVDWGEWGVAFNNAMAPAWRGEAAVRSALEQAHQAINAIFASRGQM